MILLMRQLGLVNNMNKKGFTLIELITTFALAAVIIILLINVVLIIKNIYSQNDIKSQLLIDQSNLSNVINKKLTEDALETYISCSDSDFCYNFNFIDGTSSKLVVTKDSVRFDNYVYKLQEGGVIENPVIDIILDIEVSNNEQNNSFLILKIPIKHKLYPNKNFGIDIVYQYNSNNTEL